MKQKFKYTKSERQSDSKITRWKDKEIGGQILRDMETDSQIDKDTDRETKWQKERQRYRQAEQQRQLYKEAYRQTEKIETQRDINTERQTVRKTKI